MSGYRDVPPGDGQQPEVPPSFRPTWTYGRARSAVVLAMFLFAGMCAVVSCGFGGGWSAAIPSRETAGTLLIFVVIMFLSDRAEARDEDREARARYEGSEPRFDPPRNDVL